MVNPALIITDLLNKPLQATDVDNSGLEVAVVALAVIVALGVAAVAAAFVYLRRQK